jgi:manganese-dependent inorganic pyrophosphatase
MSDKIFVIGHKSPDLDSVAAAIAYADFKNKVEQTDKYVPAITGDVNKETAFCLEKFGFSAPQLLSSLAGLEVVLVDHNEAAQSADGISEAKVVEVLDHHKIDFKAADPIQFVVLPWGSSCSIIAHMCDKNSVAISASLAGLMLSAILVDTVITKSPTCIDKDREIIANLASLAGISDWQAFGMEIFKVRSSVSELSAAGIIGSDFKDFALKAGKFGIGQVETVDATEFSAREEELMNQLNQLRQDGGYHSTVLFITDIIKEGSLFLVSSSDLPAIEAALDAKLPDGKTYIAGILSRKKQVAPKFTEYFDK